MWPSQFLSPSASMWIFIPLIVSVSPLSEAPQFVGCSHYSWLQNPEREKAGSNYQLVQKAAVAVTWHISSSAGRFQSHKASDKGISAVCSFAHCSGVDKRGTWLPCCVTTLSATSGMLSSARDSEHQDRWSLSKVKGVKPSAASEGPRVSVYCLLYCCTCWHMRALVQCWWRWCRGAEALVQAGLITGT